jgi:hypothetical protein
MDDAIAGYIEIINTFIKELSTWLVKNNGATNVTTTTAVTAMHSWATKSAAVVASGRTSAGKIVSLIPRWEALPEGIFCLGQTAPMPMVTFQLKYYFVRFFIITSTL